MVYEPKEMQWAKQQCATILNLELPFLLLSYVTSIRSIEPSCPLIIVPCNWSHQYRDQKLNNKRKNAFHILNVSGNLGQSKQKYWQNLGLKRCEKCSSLMLTLLTDILLVTQQQQSVEITTDSDNILCPNDNWHFQGKLKEFEVYTVLAKTLTTH